MAPLLATKLHRPRAAAPLVPRPRLLDALSAGLSRRLTLVSAPAGYGKSTVVNQWLDTVDLPWAWIALDEHDSDMATFLSYLLAALRSVYADAGHAVETLLRTPALPAPSFLADALLSQQRGDAAETQLTEIVALEPQNVDALVRLGRLYETWWDRDPMAIWRQVLAANPAHPEAREALADDYVKMVSDQSPFAAYRFSLAYPGKSNIETLEIGLQELPGHPKLLVALGIAYARARQSKQAREVLLQAYQAAPQDVRNVNSVLHELLHADAGDAIEDLVPAIRQIPRLLPVFWLHQATMALQCKLGEEWADFFIEEALKLGGQPWVDDTRAGLLLESFEIAHEQKANALCASLEKRIRAEVPASGAVQYIEAYRLNFEKADLRGAAKLIREAIRAARKANDKGVLRRAEAIEPVLKGVPQGMDLERILRDLFPLDR